jgi:uncharacterized membrane protein
MVLSRRWPLLVVGFLMALYLAYFGWFTMRSHDLFQTGAYDLGIYDQITWNTIRGRFFRCTIVEPFTNSIADHFEPILLLLAPFYLLWENPKTLLLIQTISLALGALPCYWLARDALTAALRRGRNPQSPDLASDSSKHVAVEVLALGFSGIYLLYPPVHSANVYEFHASALALPLLLYAFYFLRKRRFVPYFVMLFLTMSTKEVLPLTTLALGLYAFLVERQRAVGLVTMLASAAWFGLSVFVIIPHFNPGGDSRFFSYYYGWLGDDSVQVLTRLFSDPVPALKRLGQLQNLNYMKALLGPHLYIPLLGLPVLLLALPALLLNLLSDNAFQHSTQSFFHYGVAIAPFVIVASIDGTALLVRYAGSVFERIWGAGQRVANAKLVLVAIVVALILVVSLLCQMESGHLPFSRGFYLAPRDEQASAAEAIVRQVPAQGSVSAGGALVPHLSQRESVYIYPNLHDAEYLAVNVRYPAGPFPPRDTFDSIQAMLSAGQYGVTGGQYGYLVLERGLESAAIPDSFYRFAKAGDPAPQVELDVNFGDKVRLLGYDLVWERAQLPLAHLVLYWEALQPIEDDLRLFFIELDTRGEPRPATELEFVETVWYPPSRWLQGEVIRTETRSWFTFDQGPFGLAVGAVEGPGFWEIDKRLQPLVQSAPWSLPLVHGDSLLWLTTLQGDGLFMTLQQPGTEQ